MTTRSTSTMPKHIIACLAFGLVGLPAVSHAESGTAVIAPFFGKPFSCLEHFAQQFVQLGDSLGTDCSIVDMVEVDGRTWARHYRGDGRANEDWFGWQQDVLAPVAGRVTELSRNPVTNVPGVLGKGRASSLTIQAPDGLTVVLAHVDHIKVKDGDEVAEGQVVAKVGNNGFARAPHIHVGAYKDGKPLQIRFDQQKLKNAYKGLE